ncbi:MAG: hypothetical protein ACRC80_08500, partial [Waterburya sp.]
LDTYFMLNINFQILNACGTCTKRALKRTKKNFGNPVWYNPRADFVKRMAKKFNMSDAQMRKELARIHQYFREGGR